MSAVFVCQEYECECPLRPADRCVNCPKNRPSPEQAKDAEIATLRRNHALDLLAASNREIELQAEIDRLKKRLLLYAMGILPRPPKETQK